MKSPVEAVHFDTFLYKINIRKWQKIQLESLAQYLYQY